MKQLSWSFPSNNFEGLHAFLFYLQNHIKRGSFKLVLIFLFRTAISLWSFFTCFHYNFILSFWNIMKQHVFSKECNHQRARSYDELVHHYENNMADRGESERVTADRRRELVSLTTTTTTATATTTTSTSVFIIENHRISWRKHRKPNPNIKDRHSASYFIKPHGARHVLAATLSISGS